MGLGSVTVRGGVLTENVNGNLLINGDYCQTEEGILTLNICSSEDVVKINGVASIEGKIILEFAEDYIPENQSIVLTCSNFAKAPEEIELKGLSDDYEVQIMDNKILIVSIL